MLRMVPKDQKRGTPRKYFRRQKRRTREPFFIRISTGDMGAFRDFGDKLNETIHQSHFAPTRQSTIHETEIVEVRENEEGD